MTDQQTETQELNRKAWVAPAVTEGSADLLTENAGASGSDSTNGS